MSISSRELFARLIKCEAGGEGLNGMRAVATVVMNRVNVAYGEYLRTGEGDLRKIISQRNQFTCMNSTVYGELNPQTVWASPPEDIHYDVADWALSGNKLYGIERSLWYYNPFKPACMQIFPKTGTGQFIEKINQHCFYNPTKKYAKS